MYDMLFFTLKRVFPLCLKIRFLRQIVKNLRNFPCRGAEKRQKTGFFRPKKCQKTEKMQFYFIGNQYVTKKMQKK